MARLGVVRIRIARQRNGEEDENQPHLRSAYILNSLKRPEEVTKLGERPSTESERNVTNAEKMKAVIERARGAMDPASSQRLDNAPRSASSQRTPTNQPKHETPKQC